MKLEIKKWIKDGQFVVEIKGSLAADEQTLVRKYGDMLVDLSTFKSRKSFCRLSEFTASGSFANEKAANTFIKNISKRLKEIVEAYRKMPEEFKGTELHDIEGLELRVAKELRNNNYYLHISTQPDEKSRELIEKYGDQDIDVSTEKFTSHLQPLQSQSSKILSLKIDKTFENAVDAYEYVDKIKTELQQILKDYKTRKDAFSGKEEAYI